MLNGRELSYCLKWQMPLTTKLTIYYHYKSQTQVPKLGIETRFVMAFYCTLTQNLFIICTFSEHNSLYLHLPGCFIPGLSDKSLQCCHLIFLFNIYIDLFNKGNMLGPPSNNTEIHMSLPNVLLASSTIILDKGQIEIILHMKWCRIFLCCHIYARELLWSACIDHQRPKM